MSTLPFDVFGLKDENWFVSATVRVPPPAAAADEPPPSGSSCGVFAHALSTRAPAANRATATLVRLIFNVPPETWWTWPHDSLGRNRKGSGRARPPELGQR